MQILKDRIIKDGLIFPDNVLKVDSFLNHQMDIKLFNDIGKEFEVLVEGYSKRSREQLSGRTSQNKVVLFDNQGQKVGDLVRVRIKDASAITLFGDII